MRNKLLLCTFVAVFVATTACTRSASTPPPPTVRATADIQATVQAAVFTAVAEVEQTQRAQIPTQVPATQIPPTPEVVFADLLDTGEMEIARWAVENDVMRPVEYNPLLFGRDEPFTRGDMAIAIGRACLWEEIETPIGFFTDLRIVVPMGASPEELEQIQEEIRIATYSEELVQRRMYLLRDQSQPHLSYSNLVLTADEYRQWTVLALDSPECGPQSTPTSSQ